MQHAACLVCLKGHQYHQSSRLSRAAQQASESRHHHSIASQVLSTLLIKGMAAWCQWNVVPKPSANGSCAKATHACSRRIVRAFLIEEQKIVKKVVKLQQQQKAGQA